MSENLTVVLGVIGGAAVLIGGIWGLIWFNQRNDEWQGVIEDKSIHTTTDNEGDRQDWYYLHVKLAGGKTIKKRVSKKIYDQFNAGDRAIKIKGQMDPRKG